VPKKLTLSVPKHGTATKKFTVRVKRNAKGHAQITAASNGWRGRAYLKIKPSK
jgi:hypothetical protein